MLKRAGSPAIDCYNTSLQHAPNGHRDRFATFSGLGAFCSIPLIGLTAAVLCDWIQCPHSALVPVRSLRDVRDLSLEAIQLAQRILNHRRVALTGSLDFKLRLTLDPSRTASDRPRELPRARAARPELVPGKLARPHYAHQSPSAPRSRVPKVLTPWALSASPGRSVATRPSAASALPGTANPPPVRRGSHGATHRPARCPLPQCLQSA